MRQSLKVSACGVGLVSLLASCGGGGGSGPAWLSNPTEFTAWSAVPSNGSVSASGEARRSTVTIDPDTLDFAMSAGGRQNATVVALVQNDKVIAIQATTSGTTVTLDTRSGAVDLSDAEAIGLQSADGLRYVVLANPEGAGLEYQSYGTWARASDTSINTAFGSFGLQTEAGALPVPVDTVTYSGLSAGEATDAGGNLYVTESVVTLSTDDFATVRIVSDGTQAFDVLGGGLSEQPDLNFEGDLTVSGGQFSGGVTGATVTGDASGSFYGPAAEEAGGTFGTSGGGWTNVGAFGTVQLP